MNKQVQKNDLKDRAVDDFFTMTCPKTKLNIMQFCVIYSKNDQDVVKVINLFNSQSSEKLYNLIFKMKVQSEGGHELSNLSAFEIAISKG